MKIAVIGPHGDADRALIQVDTGKICPGKDLSCVRSPYAAIKAINDAASGGQTVYAQGVDVVGNDTSGLQAAMAAAQAADVLVLGLGIGECGSWGGAMGVPKVFASCHSDPDAEEQYLEAEAHDRTSIDLPPMQRLLAQRLLALGKPTVIFLLNGGMVSLQQEMAQNPAIVEVRSPPSMLERFASITLVAKPVK